MGRKGIRNTWEGKNGERKEWKREIWTQDRGKPWPSFSKTSTTRLQNDSSISGGFRVWANHPPFLANNCFFSNIRHFKIEVALQGSMIYRRVGGREVWAAWAIYQGI